MRFDTRSAVDIKDAFLSLFAFNQIYYQNNPTNLAFKESIKLNFS